jgi:anti-anti-sigma factor
MRLHTQTLFGRSSAVVRCFGDIIFCEEADHLRAEVLKVDRKVILIDIEGVLAIDAYGIGRILEILHHARDKRSVVVLVNPNQRLQELLRLTKLDFCFTHPGHTSTQVEDIPSEVTCHGERSQSFVFEVSEL